MEHVRLRIHHHNLMSQVASIKVLGQAFAHVRHARIKAHYNDDIWHLSSKKDQVIARIRQSLLQGTYQLQPLTICHGYSRWCAEDAVVLKALSVVISEALNVKPVSNTMDVSSASHLKGQGGIKGALAKAHKIARSKRHHFMIKTDIKSFYQSIHHQTLLSQCSKAIHDTRILDLIEQYCERCEIMGGHHTVVKRRGIPMGCPLSPLMGAVYLTPIDQMVKGTSCAYVRYMDDFIIFIQSRFQLRRMLKRLYGVLKDLKLTLAQDKTYIGRISHGFNFLGFHHHPSGVGVSPKTLSRMFQKLAWLYEQQASRKRLQAYLKRWQTWVNTQVGDLRFPIKFNSNPNPLKPIRISLRSTSQG